MSTNSDSSKPILTPQSSGDTFKLPLGPPKPPSKPDVVMTDASPPAQTDSDASVQTIDVPEEVPPSQIVWNLEDEQQPIDPNKKAKKNPDGSDRPVKPDVHYFWKLIDGAKIPDPRKWQPVEYALFYPPATKNPPKSLPPSATRASRSRSPAKQADQQQEEQEEKERQQKLNNKKRSSSSRDSSQASSKRGRIEVEDPSDADIEAADLKQPPLPSDCIFIKWSAFAQYRDPAIQPPLINFNQLSTGNRIAGLGANGATTSSRPLTKDSGVKDDDWPHLYDFFARAFKTSQAKSKLMDMTLFNFWTRPPNQNDGEIKFITSNEGGGIAPSFDAQYVKLAIKDGQDLVTYDKAASLARIDANAIYIDKATMTALSSGTYAWLRNCNTIPFREESGRINYLTCSAEQQNAAWWKKAFIAGVRKQEGKSIRSRNVAGLELLIIVNKSSWVTKDIINQLIKSATTNAAIPIRQTVNQVLESDEEDKIKEATAPGKFNRLLSESPFGDYETWIQEKDFISYLESYKGYDLPETPDKIRTAFQNLKPKPKAIKNNDKYAGELKKQDDTARLNKEYPKDVPGAVVGVVSSATVATAGVRNARKAVPDQGKQMGGSATSIAKEAGWTDYQDRIGLVKDTANGITWDSPGVYPAEWLHRLAFSWGSPGGNALASASTNFIFGSSEANSIMTRFEKSWQRLFSKERSYQIAIGESKKPVEYKAPPFKGLLMTINTLTGFPIVEYKVSGNEVKTTEWDKSDKGVVTNNGDSNTTVLPDYWSMTTGDLSNLSFSLFYRLFMCQKSSIRDVDLLATIFFPFQRGFFTRIEADLDFMLLDRWADLAKAKITPAMPQGSSGGYNLPQMPQPGNQVSQPPPLNVNQTTQLLNSDAFHQGSPLIVSASAPEDLPQADIWRAAVSGQPVEVGGVQMADLSVVTVDGDGHQTKVPLNTDAMADAASSGKIEALVSDKPLTSTTPPIEGGQAATNATTIEAPRELKVTDSPNGIPGRFVLCGNVKLFGKFDEQLYSYYGEPGVGLRQIVQIKPGVVKLSDYIPHLAGSDLESVQLDNTQFVYNQFDTATDEAGTWLQTNVLFSGPLESINTVLKGVFHQEKPLLHVQALMSPTNDWSKPVAPASFGLRGSIPGMHVKFADLVEFTNLGLSISVGRRRQPWPPYKQKIEWGFAFFGSLNLETPNDIAPLKMDYSLSEYASIMTLMMTIQDTSPNFFGITGLHLSNVMFTATFGIGDDTTALSLVACASLELRETSIDVSGHYTKGDWGFCCELEDFDFASLRDMYEDLFGSPLHLSDHEIEVDDLVFLAGSSGILVSGQVTIEGYSCAEASLSFSTLGVEITGEVDDIHLAKDVVLKQAALDIFIGRTSDTSVDGPGTSFRFSINGTVSFANNEISASLFIGKDATGGLVWTVYGAFEGAVSLGRIAPILKGSFLDLPLQQACIIASNVDGNSAAGSLIPASFPIIKGVQVAANLGSIGAFDHTMNNKGANTSGLMLQAMYMEDTSAFSLDITLAVSQTVAMKNKSIWSGPISLEIDISETTPSLMIKADFFVRVPNQNDPLKFTGGIRADVDEAKAFIELKDQWWNDPFGLSSHLKLGPDLALQIGIVYAGPLYPSELGVAAGLMIGEVSGQAALSISEAPNDELILIKIENLGVRDLVSFASTIFDLHLPQPDDFLDFKLVSLYLSTGTTIGTTYYPPGASFSCDAVIFGKEAYIYCGVDKTTQTVSVKGSLDPIDIGPVSISGFKPGTKAEIAVTMGTTSQSVLINGGIRIAELDAGVYLKASFLPSVTFELQSELDFSTHLKFVLNANMRGGSFKSMSGLKSLEFDIYVLFQQDILDYIIAQVNMQILAAKKAVDDGIQGAEAALTKAQQIFDDQIKVAQGKVDDAKSKYDLKVAQVQGAFQAEKTKSDLKIKQLQAEVDRTFQVFSGAVAKAQNDLRVANENRANAIRNAQQDVTNAKNTSDSKINQALKNVTNAQNDMQNRFGNALNNLSNAQHSVDSAHGVVDNAQHDVDNAKHELDHCHWYEKVPKAAVVAAMGTKLEGAKAGLELASKALDAAKAIVSGPGYAAANASINFYQADLNGARKAADEALNATNGALQTTINVQNGFVNAAQSALTTIQSVGKELQDSNLAKKVLQDFQNAETLVLNGLSTAVSGLMNCAEKVAFDAANAGLNIARANTKDLDVANSALKFAEHSTDEVMDAGAWVVKHTLNILNLKKVELTGDLRGLCQQGTQLKAHIVGTFAEQNVDFSVDYMPAQGEEMVKNVFKKLMGDIKSGALAIAKDL